MQQPRRADTRRSGDAEPRVATGDGGVSAASERRPTCAATARHVWRVGAQDVGTVWFVLPLRFVPYHELGGRPNVIVDGSATEGTVLTLSHWPGSPTPDDLLDDLSAQIAFRALDHPERFAGAEFVSNNHFDQDGLMSAFALVDQTAALARRELAIDVARAGDFGTFENRDGARLAFALAAYDDPDRSPLGAGVLTGSYDSQCGTLYEALLPRCAELLDDPESLRPLWEEEDAHLTASLEAIDAGVVTIREHAAVDLALVTVPDSWAERAVTRFTVERLNALHPMAVNQSTQRMRVLVHHDGSWRLECRYETWVMFRSHPVMPRPDLRDHAHRLDDLEIGAGGWTADRPGALTPQLVSPLHGTTLATAVVEREIIDFLASAPPAWEPLAGR